MAGIPEPVDFGIVVALSVELEAVLRQCPSFVKEVHESDDNLTYYVGRIASKAGDYRAAVVLLPSVGNVGSAVATKDLLARYSPGYVLMIGIAGGTRPKSQQLGDVIISEEVLYYELAKLKSDSSDIRTKSLPANPRLLDRAKHYNDSLWHQRIHAAPPIPLVKAPVVHIGPIASGEKVVANRDFLEQLLRINSKILGVEMESWGVVSATQSAPNLLGFLGVRAISDFADSQKVDSWQRYAAESAASWAIKFLESGPVAPKVTLSSSGLAESAERSPTQGVHLRWKATTGSQWRVEMNEMTITDNSITGHSGTKNTTSEKLKTKRVYEAKVLSVRRNGVFRMQFSPLSFDLSFIHSHNGALAGTISVGKKPQIDGEGQMTVASPMMSKILEELMGIDLFFEVTPNGVVISAESTKDPFRSGNYIGNSPMKGLEYFQWLSTGRDQPDNMAIFFFVQTPTAEAREGLTWSPQLKWNAMGLEISGTTLAELKQLVPSNHGGVAHVVESGQLSVDTREFGRGLKSAFLAEEPRAEIEIQFSPNPKYETHSEWSFDIEGGELQSKRCSNLDLTLGMSLVARKGKQFESKQLVVNSRGSNTVVWIRK